MSLARAKSLEAARSYRTTTEVSASIPPIACVHDDLHRVAHQLPIARKQRAAPDPSHGSGYRLRYTGAGGRGRGPLRVIVLETEAPKINPFDANIIHFLNRFAQKSWLLDRSVSFVGNDVLIRGGVITALLWWAWFRGGESKTRDRELVLSGIMMSCAALFAARALALWLPFRERPCRVPEVAFRLPFGATSSNLIHWSSFPSDHAALFFSLATCLYLISRQIGILAYCHAFFIVCLPRVYMGMHYPTDILAGAFLGIGITQLATIQGLRECIAREPLRWMEESPELFYPCFYLMTFLVGTNFDSVRDICVAVWQAVRAVVQHRL